MSLALQAQNTKIETMQMLVKTRKDILKISKTKTKHICLFFTQKSFDSKIKEIQKYQLELENHSNSLEIIRHGRVILEHAEQNNRTKEEKLHSIFKQ